MSLTDEQISAYLDGELPDDELKAVEKALDADPAAAARLAAFRRVDSIVKEAHGAPEDQEIPDAVLSLLEDAEPDPHEQPTAEVIPFRAKIRGVPLALAASIALGVGVTFGPGLMPGNQAPGTPSLAYAVGPLPSADPLVGVLETAASAERVAAGPATVTPVLSFATVDGRYCREVNIAQDAEAIAAVACRSEGIWTIAVTAASEPVGPVQGFETASDPQPAGIATFVEQMKTGDALSVEEERRLIASGWGN